MKKHIHTLIKDTLVKKFNSIKSAAAKYKLPENRFYTIKNYRLKSQVFIILNVTIVVVMSQQCTGQMRVLESTQLSSSLPVIYLVSDVPPLTNSRSVSVVFDVSLSGSATFRSANCQLDQGASFDCSSKVVNLTSVVDGDHTLKINADSSTGDEAQTLNVVFRVDATKPVAAILQAPSATTGSNSASITFSATDALSGVNRVECSLDNAAFTTCTSPTNLSNLAAGAHSFRVRATDRATNVSDIATANWTVDAGAPILNITAKPAALSAVKTASFSFNGTVSGVAMTDYECKLDAAAYATCTSGQSYSNLAEGSHTFSVRGRLGAGTMSSPVSATWTVDTVAPTLPVITNNVSAQTQLKNASLSFTSTDAGGAPTFQCALDAGTYANCTSPHVFTNLADGTRTFRVRATDLAGNVSAVATATWVIDTVLPALAFTQTPTTSTNTAANFAFTASDAGVGLQSVQCSLNNAAYATCTSPQNLTVAVGSHIYRVQATDRVGNTQTITHTWSVNTDTPPPTGGEYPIMFVTSVPSVGFNHLTSNFGNHSPNRAGHIPGGDLYIRYPNGTLRNLTREAGYGVESGQLQGNTGIVVREPTIHWSGTKAIFSMTIGGTPSRYNVTPNRRYQIYEVTGLEQGQTAVITKLAGQPSNYNNVSPMYGANDDIFFTSDAPLFGMTHTYPQLDEYESTTTTTGIWKLEPATNKLTQIQHSPSGSFHLFLDSFGRIIFTRWDHLKRDQQADHDRNGRSYGSFDYKDETPGATKFVSPQQDAQGRYIADTRGVLYDLFPEARDNADRSRRSYENFHDFNKFTPWMIHEDGSEEEIVNHAGRDEIFRDYRDPAFNNDPNLTSTMTNFAANRLILGGDGGFFHFKEDINRPGYFLGVFGLEFGRETSGRVVEIKMDPGTNPEDMIVTDYSGPLIDADPTGSQPRQPGMTGHYRNPLRMSDGSILVSHTDEYRQNGETVSGTGAHTVRYSFRLKKLVKNTNNSYYSAGSALTGSGIVKDIRWWQDDAFQHSYNGLLHEIDPVEIRPRPRPVMSPRMKIADIEKTVIQEQGVNEQQFKDWLKRNNLAVIVSRNVTIRDRADVSQPFNLRIPAGVQNIPTGGKVYDISKLQIFQADLTRGYSTVNGRRVYAKPIHNSPSHPNMQTFYGGQANGMATLGADGSMAAIVPAGRALTWQLTSDDGTPVVRERYWITFAPGEVRTCASCHGLNKVSHNNLPEPTNKPEAFRLLLNNWKTQWWQIEPQ